MLKSGIYDFVICRGGTNMCFVLGFGRKRPDLKQYRISGLTAIIPSDIEFDSPRHTMYTEAEAKEAREDGVDLREEACLLALSRSAIYQQKLRQYHSKKIRPLAFHEGDLV